MIGRTLPRCIACAVLSLTLLTAPACSKKKSQDEPTADTPGTASTKANSPKASKAPRARLVFTVPATPPGAPTTGALLAFPKTPPTFFDWRKTGRWSPLVRTNYRLPKGHRRAAAKILRKGWTAADNKALAKHLSVFTADLSRAIEMPACAPLRARWSDTELLLQHWSLFTLKALHEGLGLLARQHQHHKRPAPALKAALGSLRFACHMAHIPELIMQLMALRAEQQSLGVLSNLSRNPTACAPLKQVLMSNALRRATLHTFARADWLMARSHLRMITKDLTKTPSADAQAQRRLRKLEQLILDRTSAQYQRYSRLVRQGLATNRPSDWKHLDDFLAQHRAALSALKKKHGARTSSDLTAVVSKLPNKPPAWTADVLSKVFLAMVTVRASIWKRARQLHRLNGETLRKLRGTTCPAR